MQTFNFFESTLHLEDFSRCWAGNFIDLPRFNQFTYIARTIIHIKESFSIEIPKSIVGDIDYRLVNYCHLKVNNLDFYYFVKPLKTEITQNNMIFYLEKDEYFSNNLNLGVEYKQTKGIIMGGYRGDAYLNYMSNTQNEMASNFQRLQGSLTHTNFFELNGKVIGRHYAVAHFVFRMLEDSADEPIYKSRTSSKYFHCAAFLHDIDYFEGFYAIANMTKCSPESDSEVEWKVECVRAYIVPRIFYNTDIFTDTVNTEHNVQFVLDTYRLHTLYFITADFSNTNWNCGIRLPMLHTHCGRNEITTNEIANGENIYLCTQNRKWKLPPYTACHGEFAVCNYNVEMSFNTTDLDIVLSGDFNEWNRENIAQDFEESVFIDSGVIQMLENENLRKTNKIYQGIGIGMSAVGGVANAITNPMSILGGVNSVINSTKGMALDYAREQDLKNKYNVVGNSGGVSNIVVCNSFNSFTGLPTDYIRGWYFAYKPYSIYRGNDGYLLYEQLVYGYTMPEHVTQTQSKPSTRYMDIVKNLLETAYYLVIFYPKISLANAKNLYARYQVGYDCRYFTTRKSSKKFELALSNGIIFYGKR